MIEPEYLAALRRRHRVELVLTMVQLAQRTPGWWLSLSELADELGTDRASLNKTLIKLEKLDLLRRWSISNTGGTLIWWVKQSEHDAPSPKDEPAWVLRNIRLAHSQLYRVTVADRWDWAKRRKIPRGTMRSFLAGHQRVMRGRWELVSTPMDCFNL